MDLVKKTLLFLLPLVAFEPVKAKEFISLKLYLTIYPNALHNGKDGNWLKTDREKNTEVWNQANKNNIKKPKGYLEYIDIYQRCSFYKWFEHQSDSLGFETKWPKAAKTTTSKLKKLLNPISSMVGNSNAEIKEFVITGNEIIFNDIWSDLKSLLEKSPLKHTDAEIWDGHLLLKEQNLIDPYYKKLSKASLKKLQKSLRKESKFSKILPGYEFEGDLLAIKDRWLYGMKMMHYENPNINK